MSQNKLLSKSKENANNQLKEIRVNKALPPKRNITFYVRSRYILTGD